MAYPLSKWFRKKHMAQTTLQRLHKGGYAKSNLYIITHSFKYGPTKSPKKAKYYRVMHRKR